MIDLSYASSTLILSTATLVVVLRYTRDTAIRYAEYPDYRGGRDLIIGILLTVISVGFTIGAFGRLIDSEATQILGLSIGRGALLTVGLALLFGFRRRDP